MCRSIKPLFNFDPPTSHAEIENAALQYVRKISGFKKPSKRNEEAFNSAVSSVSIATKILIETLVTDAETKNREVEQAKAIQRSRKRFGE